MYCANHPVTEAIGVCTGCGRAVCRDCSALVDDRLLCRSCVLRKRAMDRPAPAGSGDDLLTKLVIIGALAVIGIIVMVGITVILAGVIAAFVFGMSGGVQQASSPAFTIHKNIADSTYTITLMDMGGAGSIKGLSIEAPYLTQPDLVDPDTRLYVGQSETFRVPGQAGKAHFIVTSTVDGDEKIVLDTYA